MAYDSAYIPHPDILNEDSSNTILELQLEEKTAVSLALIIGIGVASIMIGIRLIVKRGR